MEPTNVLCLLSEYLPVLWVQVGSGSFLTRVRSGDAFTVADDLRRTLLGWGCKAPAVCVFYVAGQDGATLMVSQIGDLPEADALAAAREQMEAEAWSYLLGAEAWEGHR